MRLISFLTILFVIGLVQTKLPTFTRGVYVILADNTVKVKNDQGQDVSSTGIWEPIISSWIQQFNVVFFTFINADMFIPPAFEFARQNVNFASGTKLIYSIGGYAYSQDPNWRNTFSNPKQLASQVAAQWNSDGIDLDLEDPIGNDPILAKNIVIFAKELKRLRPDFIITQPVFGYPQIFSESLITVESWDSLGQSKNVADAVGLMVYTGSGALQFVGNYAGTACTQWYCALCDAAKVSAPCAAVPVAQILAGLGGDANDTDVATVCGYQSGGKRIGGYMVWYASADNGFQYGGSTQDGRISQTKWNQCQNDDNEDFAE